jgi:RimJ/RimL family protein N-acetyltransferase
MIQLSPTQLAQLRSWFPADQPGPQIGLHIINTGNGACFADRWPGPRAVLADSAGNYFLSGEPDYLAPGDLQGQISGFVEAPEQFVPLLQATFPDLKVWQRVILSLEGEPDFSLPQEYTVRPLGLADVHHLWGLNPDLAWIARTWGGPTGLASSGHAWGAFTANKVVSVACSFFVGDQYEDIGVVTESAFRGHGLSAACAGALCEEIRSRGRRPSWTTSPDNTASIRVAEKLGFVTHRRDRLYITQQEIPRPAHR